MSRSHRAWPRRRWRHARHERHERARYRSAHRRLAGDRAEQAAGCHQPGHPGRHPRESTTTERQRSVEVPVHARTQARARRGSHRYRAGGRLAGIPCTVSERHRRGAVGEPMRAFGRRCLIVCSGRHLRASPVDTSTWVPFTSRRFGYSICYPSDWTAREGTDPLPVGSTGDVGLPSNDEFDGPGTSRTSRHLAPAPAECPEADFLRFVWRACDAAWGGLRMLARQRAGWSTSARRHGHPAQFMADTATATSPR